MTHVVSRPSSQTEPRSKVDRIKGEFSSTVETPSLLCIAAGRSPNKHITTYKVKHIDPVAKYEGKPEGIFIIIREMLRRS